MSTFYPNDRDYLSHHGIKGQKWGIKNGPPYPLSSATHKAVVSGKNNKKPVDKKKIANKMRENRRKKILHDPKKLYKHASEFSKKEIDEAYEKLQSMNRIKSMYSEDKKRSPLMEKVAKKAEDKRMNKKIDKYARTPDMLSKNMHKLSQKEVSIALDRLEKRQDMFDLKMSQVDRPRAVVQEIIDYLSTLSRLGKAVGKLFQDPQVGKTKLTKADEYRNWKIKTNQIHLLSEQDIRSYKLAKGERLPSPGRGYGGGRNRKRYRQSDSGRGASMLSTMKEIADINLSIVSDTQVERLRNMLENLVIDHSDIKSMNREELTDYLMHHGIKGQKWGVKHGPPYPLDAKEHKQVVKGAGTSSKPKAKSESKQKSKDGLFVELYLVGLGLSALSAAYVKARKAIGNRTDNKIEEKFNELINNKDTEAKYDKKTGFKLKDREMTEKEDLKAANPLRSNDTYTKSTRYNCVYCSHAYELRRRGFDVMAKLSKEPVSTEKIFGVYPKAKPVLFDPFECFDLDDKGRPNGFVKIKNVAKAKERYAKARNEIKKQFRNLASEEGSRGYLSIQWRNGGGHLTTYFVKDGKVKIADPQSGKILTFNEEYLDKVICGFAIRTDNIKNSDINFEEIKRYVV